jgi:uncharacterized DUF497 family protein
VEFSWDEAKHAKTLGERGIGFDDAARIFLGRVLVWEDVRHDYGERRFRAVGMVNEVLLHIVFTPRRSTLRIISVRRASAKESKIWRSGE